MSSSNSKKTEAEEPRGIMRMFRGISLSQLVAGALASVTALFLSTHIGLAGSLIGAAVSFSISSISSQVFNNLLKDSRKQLMNVVGGGDDAEGSGSSPDGDKESDGTARRTVSSAGSANAMASDGSTVAMPPVPGGRVATSGRPGVPPVPPPPSSAKAGRAATSKGTFGKKGIPRGRVIAIVLSVATALVGVAATALIVMALTGGKGTDTVVKDVFVPQPTQSQTVDGNQQYGQTTDGGQQSGQTDGSQQSGQTTTDGTTTDGTTGTGTTGTDGTTGSTTTDGTTGSTGTGSSGTSGSDSTGTGSSSGSTSGSTGSTGSTGSGTTGSDSTGTGSGTSSGTTGSDSTGTGSSSGTGTGSTGSESTSGTTGSDSTGTGSSSSTGSGSTSGSSSSSSGTSSNTAAGAEASESALH